MAKSVSAIRFEQDEKEWITTFAELNGKSFSAQVREWVLDRLEDEMDTYDLSVSLKDSAEDLTDTGITMAEFSERYES